MGQNERQKDCGLEHTDVDYSFLNQEHVISDTFICKLVLSASLFQP